MALNVLIVEDDELLREMYAAKFELEGFDVATAVDGEAGLAAALNRDFDLIILDNLMPRCTGLDMLERYRKKKPESPARVFFLSNKSSLGDINRAKQLGAADYFLKSSYTPRELVQKVSQLLA